MSMNNGGGWYIPFTGFRSGENDLKSMHDHYDVYVNGDFIGQKVLVSPSEEVDDISSYLHNCHFEDFTASLDGDHYHIQADTNDTANLIKGQLEAYLNIR